MNSRMPFVIAALLVMCVSADGLALSGRWRGNLKAGPVSLPLVFDFKTDASGELAATMDSPQQNARDIPLDVLFSSADSISLECPMICASFQGRVEERNIEGVFLQRGYRLPLTLTPEDALSERRPQTPVPPFPYLTTDTVFRSADGTELAGTLTVPDSESADGMPVVVMVTGSGPQNRDEEIMGHVPFAVIADYLARNGVASFRYDDRGVGKSKGIFEQAALGDFKADALGAFRFVRGLPGFGRAGILGHSEGGTLALLIAGQGEKPDFIVSLAGMAVPAKETLLAQNARLLDSSGITGDAKEVSLRLLEIMFDEIKGQYLAGKTSHVDIDAICAAHSLDVPAPVLESVRRSEAARNAYFDSLVSLDPADAMKRIECPVLAVNGMKDVQVDAESNLAAIRANVRDVELRPVEGLNHLMQHAVTGDVSEYESITETVAPEVLAIIRDFIVRD